MHPYEPLLCHLNKDLKEFFCFSSISREHSEQNYLSHGSACCYSYSGTGQNRTSYRYDLLKRRRNRDISFPQHLCFYKDKKNSNYVADTETKKRFQTDANDYKYLQIGYNCLTTGTGFWHDLSLTRN